MARRDSAIRRMPIPIIQKPQEAQRRMSLGESLIHGNGLDRGGLRFPKCLLRFHSEEISQLDEALRNAGVGRAA